MAAAGIAGRLRPSSPAGAVLVLLLVVLLLAGLAVGLAVGLATTGVSWPAGVAPIAAFVSHCGRGLAFLRSVPVHFQTPKVFDRDVAEQTTPTSAATLAAARQYASELRALGLLDGSVNLVAAETAADEAGGVLGYYTPTTKAVYLRGRTLTPAVRVTLAHELTHALQDQHFGLNRLGRHAVTEQQQFGLTALEEGDAVLDEDDYQASLPVAQQRQATAQPTTTGGTAGPTVPVLTVTSSVPYVLGPDLVNVLYAVGGNAAIDTAYRRPPASELDVLDPVDYLQHLGQRALPAPALPPGAHRQGSTPTFGAFTLYLTLAARLPARTALADADAWGGGSMVQYRTATGQSCLAADLVGRSPAGTATLASALAGWAAAMPAGQASVTTTGLAALAALVALASAGDTTGTASAAGAVQLTACDPGKAAKAGPGTLGAALTVADQRNQNEVDALYAGATPTVAGCVGDDALADRALLRAETAENAYGTPPASATRTVNQGIARLVRRCGTTGHRSA